MENTQIKSAAFGRLPSFFKSLLVLLFFADVGRLSRLSVSELESLILGEAETPPPPRDLGVIADEMDDFLDDDGVGVRSLLADAIL